MLGDQGRQRAGSQWLGSATGSNSVRPAGVGTAGGKHSGEQHGDTHKSPCPIHRVILVAATGNRAGGHARWWQAPDPREQVWRQPTVNGSESDCVKVV